MLTTKAIFHRKVDDFEPKNCVIEKVISLSSRDYGTFSKNMLADYDFIKDNIDLQYCDNNGVFHCLLVVGEDRKDGILVESEGSSYARHSAFLPNAVDFLAAAMEQEQSAEKKTVVSDHCSGQDYGKWVTHETESTLDESSNEPQPEHQKIKVVKVEPYKAPCIAEIGNDLDSMQKAVGGYIQTVDLVPHVTLVCNEEGKLLGLEGNRSLGNDIIVGSFFIAGCNEEGEFISLTEEQTEEYVQKFLKPDGFTKEQINEATGFTFISF